MTIESEDSMSQDDHPFEIDELEDQDLDEVSGGDNAVCKDQQNTNCAGANCVSGCGG